MKLRGIEFGNVLGASGVQGFFGEGYWFHHLPFIGANFSGMTFVAKTATGYRREGNMELTADYRPRRWFPSCVKVKFSQGVVLNSVGLSNPGIGNLLLRGEWQARREPFFISVASIQDTAEKRLKEFRIMASILKIFKGDFCAPFGLQINLSCPNTGHDPKVLIAESEQMLEILADLEVPLIPKYSIASNPFEAIMELSRNPLCDAICVSNTVPYHWMGIGEMSWGAKESPLAKFGGGGISGKTLCVAVILFIEALRSAGFSKPINGGGGILCKDDVDCYRMAGASSVFLGSVAILRPWRVQKIIRYANSLDWK